ncbi:MAG: hypothetical protein M3Z23_13090, partial [Acidobacteriota bacterium]|nr:hypothetical protein [Acidobacteriota bacterium]
MVSRVGFVYDGDGNLIEEQQTSFAETLPPEMLASLNEAQSNTMREMLSVGGEPMRRLHRYNEQGRRIESRWGMGPLGS